MLTDLTHNKIISDTLTDRFVASVETVLIPLVTDVFGESAIAVQMYEDYLSDGLTAEGRWFYPLTVLTDDGARTLWISWSVDKKNFKGGIPYSYVGEADVDFRVEETVPIEFAERVSGRNTYAPNDYIKIKLHSASDDPLFLSGKYSQTFIDEMARQLTDEISRALSVSGLEEAELSLQMIFAPETYMEHTSENVTYRRLRLTDRTSAPRDFWIKWTRTNAAVAYSVSDAPILGTIEFELGEDVSQKIREKEYRFLLKQGVDKYHNAMGRKNITEWRELIKRAIKRGELFKNDLFTDAAYRAEDDEKLNKLLAGIATGTAPLSEDELRISESDGTVEDALRKLLEDVQTDEEPEVYESVQEPEEKTITEEPVSEDTEDDAEELLSEETENDEEELAPEDDIPAEGTADNENALTEAEKAADRSETEESSLKIEENKEKTPRDSEFSDDMREQMIRAEIEAKVRLEYESIARMKAEEEAKKLLEEQEKLRRENERLLEEARRLEEVRVREEAARREREERLKAEIEAKVRAEAREKERLAEAAMLAIEEKRRLEKEKAEADRRAEEEARRKEAERRAEEERARQEEARRIEAERLRAEEEARRKREEEEAERAAAEAAKTVKKGYTFTTKRVMFFFRGSVDPNITEPMEAIIRSTLESTGKTNVPINIRASVVDEKSVCLDFVRIPEEEEDLLIKIVQALGQGGLGIVKARVE